MQGSVTETVDLSDVADTHFDIGGRRSVSAPTLALGAGYQILVVRGLSGLFQRALARNFEGPG